MAVKLRKLKELLGKDVRIRGRHNTKDDGVFRLLGFDPPYLCLSYEGQEFWWHTDAVEALTEVVDETK